MEENSKAIVRRLLERVVGAGDESAVDELIHPDCELHHSAAPGGALYSRSLAAEVLCSYARAFPDLQLTIEALLAEGEEVAARYSWSGIGNDALAMLRQYQQMKHALAEQIRCTVCQQPIQSKDARARYCSPRCWKQAEHCARGQRDRVARQRCG